VQHINAAGLALIKQYGALILEANVTPEGDVVIGYGHTARGIRPGSHITEDEAGRLLSADLAWIEEAVSTRVRVELNDNEFSALVSLVFDIGIRRFSESTLLKFINKEQKARAAEAMMWLERSEPGRRAVASPGVSRRRCLEQALFLSASDDVSSGASSRLSPLT